MYLRELPASAKACRDKRTARASGASCLASVVLPEPGKPQIRMSRACCIAAGHPP
jgi:hypothetical protein